MCTLKLHSVEQFRKNSKSTAYTFVSSCAQIRISSVSGKVSFFHLIWDLSGVSLAGLLSIVIVPLLRCIWKSGALVFQGLLSGKIHGLKQEILILLKIWGTEVQNQWVEITVSIGPCSLSVLWGRIHSLPLSA